MSEYRFDQIAINSTEKKKPEESDKYTYIGLEHLDSRDLEVHRWGAEVAPKGEKLLMKKGDVLFGKRRAYQKKVAIAPFDGIFSAHGMVLRPNEKIVDKDFFPLFISSDYFLDAAIKISVGSLSPTINWRDLRELKFCLPDLETQRKLAKVLWAINATMQKYKVLLAKTDELVKSQFIELFGLVDENPYEFPRVPITEVCDFQGGSQPPKKDWIKKEKDGYIRMLQIRDFTQSEKDNIEYVKITNSIKTCKEEDVLIGRYGASVGKILTGLSGAYNVAIMKSIPDLSKLNRTYLRYYFLSDEFQGYVLSVSASRAAQAGFSKEDLNRMQILLAPIELQKQFERLVVQSDKSKFGKEMCDKWILEIQNIYRQGYLI